MTTEPFLSRIDIMRAVGPGEALNFTPSSSQIRTGYSRIIRLVPPPSLQVLPAVHGPPTPVHTAPAAELAQRDEFHQAWPLRSDETSEGLFGEGSEIRDLSICGIRQAKEDKRMWVLLIMTLGFGPWGGPETTGDPIVNATAMQTITGFRSQATCEAAAKPLANYSRGQDYQPRIKWFCIEGK
jgi:hypothetical protein